MVRTYQRKKPGSRGYVTYSEETLRNDWKLSGLSGLASSHKEKQLNSST